MWQQLTIYLPGIKYLLCLQPKMLWSSVLCKLVATSLYNGEVVSNHHFHIQEEYFQTCLMLICREHLGEKRSGEWSRISWAYSPKVVMTNEIARSGIITSTFLTTVKFLKPTWVSILFWSWFGVKCFWKWLGDTVTKVCASPRNLTFDHFSSWEGGVWGRDYF